MYVTLRDTSNIHEQNEEKTVTIVSQEPVSAHFTIDNLLLMIRGTPLNAQVQLALSPDYPLVVEYRIPGYGHMRYYLAPTFIPNED